MGKKTINNCCFNPTLQAKLFAGINLTRMELHGSPGKER